MTMNRLVPLLLLIASFVLASPGPNRAVPSPYPQTAYISPAPAPVVYLSDFELDVFRGRGERRSPPRTSPSTAAGSTPATAPVAQRSTSPGTSSKKPAPARTADAQSDDYPAERANELVNAMSENLLSALEKAGYKVQRLRGGGPRPEKGLRIRGVFAEADERNRARRLLFGSDSPAPNMLLYVGVNNLTKPEQPLYEFANPPSNDSRYGPVITVTSYSPAARFELSKDPTDEDLKKIAAQIAADLTALLNANPMMIAQ